MDMGKAAPFLLVGLVVAGLGFVGFTTSADSGTAEFEILKRVSGTPPAGALFEVRLACDGVTITPGGQSEAVVRFVASGTPQDPAAFQFEGSGTCTVTETQTGNATSVTYECVLTAGETGVPPACTPSGPQADPVTLNVTTPRSASSVTVTNSFEPAVPPPVGVPARVTG
jgi:hypothetical protein